MAFTLNTATLAKNYEHICSTDPALDQEDEDFGDKYERYTDTGDPSHLPVKPGEEPTRFTLRHLTELEKRRLMDMASTQSVQIATLYAACAMAVEDVEIRDGSGKKVDIRHDRDSSGIKHLTDSSMDLLGQLDGAINSVGSRVFMEMFPGKKS